ncbi:MAG: hypothetical protein Tsb0020_01630 [Haliangiales bacterium]
MTSPTGDAIGAWSAKDGTLELCRLDGAAGAQTVEMSAARENLSLTGLSSDGAFIFDETDASNAVRKRWSIGPAQTKPTAIELGDDYTVTVQQHIDTWQVSASGQVLIPVLTPQGLAVVAYTPSAASHSSE